MGVVSGSRRFALVEKVDDTNRLNMMQLLEMKGEIYTIIIVLSTVI